MNVICQNSNGNTIDFMTDDNIRLVDIQGLGATCTISTMATAGNDGETITNNVLNKRNVTMILKFKGNAEAGEMRLFDLFKLKSQGTLYINRKSRKAKINYEVEKVEIPPNVYPLQAQISLICANGYFEALEEVRTQLAGVTSCFRLPFHIPATGGFKIAETSIDVFTTVTNESSVDVGAEFILYASANVVNPLIENVNTGDKMQLDFTMQSDDVITITTHKGNKRITLLRGETVSNLSNYKIRPFKFIQLAPGDNVLKRDATSGVNSLIINCYHKTLWGGV